MKPLSVILAALLMVCLTHGTLHAAATSLLLAGAPSYELSGHLEQYVDPSGKLTLADLLAPATAAHFIPIPGTMNRSYSRDTVWLRFSMIRSAAFPDASWLRLSPPYLDQVTVYLQTGSEPAQPASYRVIPLGDHIPVAERPVQHPDFVAPLLLPLERPVAVYLQIRSTSAVCLQGAIHTPADMIRQNSANIMFQGGYLGIALVIGLVNLIVFLRIRDRLFLYFALYVFALFIQHLSIQGMLAMVWPAHAHQLSDYLVGMGMGALVLLFSPFAIRLFDTPRFPWVHRYFLLLSLLGGLTMLSVPLDFYGSMVSITMIALLGALLLMPWLSIRAIMRGEPAGMLYLAAFGASSFGYAAQFLRLLGVIPLAWWNIHTTQFASLLNMVLMTLALTERLHAAERKAMKAAQESEQKAVELATDMTRELRLKKQDLQDALASEQHALKQSTRFLAMLSHEYRTPLAIIRANLNLLEQREEQTGSPHEPRLATMQHAVNRLVEVMEVSLRKDRLGHSTAGKTDETIELALFMDEVIDSAERFWPDRLFVFDPENVTATVSGNPGQLKTALLNLLDNACKYSPPESPVMIECQADDEMAVISVRDQGKGLSRNEAEGLFEKYRRGSDSQGTSGAGIGLWLVRQIAEQHGGSITLAPDVKEGTVATLWLPLTS